MIRLGVFQDLLFELFDRFVAERRDAKKWAVTQKQIHQWVADRSTRR